MVGKRISSSEMGDRRNLPLDWAMGNSRFRMTRTPSLDGASCRKRMNFASLFEEPGFDRGNVASCPAGLASKSAVLTPVIAPPGQEGWLRGQERSREASLIRADGVVAQGILSVGP